MGNTGLNGAFGRNLMSAPGYKSELTIRKLSDTYCALVPRDPSAASSATSKHGFFNELHAAPRSDNAAKRHSSACRHSIDRCRAHSYAQTLS